MLNNSTELSEMVATRISHDLIGNIGALSSAMELIEENNNSLDDDIYDIIKTASTTLVARQKFFRLAFGFENKNNDLNSIEEICKQYLSTIGNPSNPIELELQGVSPELAKIIFLSVMIAAEVCIKGGKISLLVNKNNMIIAVNSNFALSEAKINIYKEILKNKKPEENSSQYVHLFYLRELLGDNVQMQLIADEKSMKIMIK